MLNTIYVYFVVILWLAFLLVPLFLAIKTKPLNFESKLLRLCLFSIHWIIILFLVTQWNPNFYQENTKIISRVVSEEDISFDIESINSKSLTYKNENDELQWIIISAELEMDNIHKNNGEYQNQLVIHKTIKEEGVLARPKIMEETEYELYVNSMVYRQILNNPDLILYRKK